VSESLRRTEPLPQTIDWGSPDNPESETALVPTAPMTVLVADDDPVAGQLTERVLTRAGYNVIAVADGLLAMQYLTGKDGPRLALLDWSMPGIDGPEVCRRMRALTERPYVYLILLTSRESKTDMLNGFEAGSDDYLTKPCYAEELKARLRAGQRILRLEDKLVHDAHHDPLTQLPNRSWFLARLGTCFERRKERRDFRFAVLFLDLDGFKEINDQLGHSAGDQLLKLVARRLTRGLRPDDLILRAGSFHDPPSGVSTFAARMGGDEFTVLLEGIQSEADAAAVAGRLERELSAPFRVNQHRVTISASIGFAVGGAEAASAQDLLALADAAMYRVKGRRARRSATFAEAVA
jgi:two-component system cell cycle response regulator